MKEVIAIRFEAEVLKTLRQIAKERNISVSALVAEAAGWYLDAKKSVPTPDVAVA